MPQRRFTLEPFGKAGSHRRSRVSGQRFRMPSRLRLGSMNPAEQQQQSVQRKRYCSAIFQNQPSASWLEGADVRRLHVRPLQRMAKLQSRSELYIALSPPLFTAEGSRPASLASATAFSRILVRSLQHSVRRCSQKLSEGPSLAIPSWWFSHSLVSSAIPEVRATLHHPKLIRVFESGKEWTDHRSVHRPSRAGFK